MKKYKKIIIITLCFCLIFQSFFYNYFEVSAEAATAAMLSDDMFKAVFGPMLVAAGLTFSTQRAFDDVLRRLRFKVIEGGLSSNIPQKPGDPKPPRSWQDWLTKLFMGAVVFDVGKQLYKNIVDIGSDVWYFVKSFVDENYNVGENHNSDVWIGGDSVPVTSVEVGKTVRFFLKDKGYATFTRTGYYSFTSTLVSGSFSDTKSRTFEYEATSPVRLSVYSEQLVILKGYGAGSDIIIHGIPLGSMDTSDMENPSSSSVYGTPDIVDNPDYSFQNASSGSLAIAYDVATDPYGQPALDADGYPMPQLAPDYMIGVTPSDIANQDLSGIPVTPPDGGVVPDPEAPPKPEDIPDSDYDTPNKRLLLMRKFPFSLPYDLKNLFSLLSAAPEAPKIEIDFFKPIRNKYNISGATKFYYDMNEFPLVGQMSRFFSLMSACLGLILVTRKIMNS